jgi:hypothetical protein
MYSKIRWLAAFLLISLFSGCEWRTYDISNEVPFNSYVGVTGILKEPMTLREQRKHRYSFVPYTLGGPEHEPISVEERVVCDLPAGTEIKTTAVKVIEVGGLSIYLLGLVKNPYEGKWVEFEILLGGCSATGAKEIHVMRMPWESDDVPEHRYIPLKKPLPGIDPWAK